MKALLVLSPHLCEGYIGVESSSLWRRYWCWVLIFVKAILVLRPHLCISFLMFLFLSYFDVVIWLYQFLIIALSCLLSLCTYEYFPWLIRGSDWKFRHEGNCYPEWRNFQFEPNNHFYILFFRRCIEPCICVVLSVLRQNNYIFRSRNVRRGSSLIRWRRNVWQEWT